MGYQLDRISIMVVEDNRPMLDITKNLLLSFGVGDVICCTDGEEGYKRFLEFNPDIIIADWMMEPMDGIELTRIIRSNSDSPNPYVPIILMTSFSEKKRVIEARDAGVTEFIVKPYSVKDIYKRLVQVIERPRQFVDAEDFFGPDRRRKKRKSYKGPFRRELDITKTPEMREAKKRQKVTSKTDARVVRGRSRMDDMDTISLDSNDDFS